MKNQLMSDISCIKDYIQNDHSIHFNPVRDSLSVETS